MKKSLLFTFVLICLLALSGCKNHEIYQYAGGNEYFEIKDCYLEIYDDTVNLNCGSITLKETEQFENLVSCTINYYLAFDVGSQFLLGSHTIEDETNGIKLDGFKIGNHATINGGSVHLFKNPESKLIFEITTSDVNGIENVYKVEMKLQ